MHLAAVAGSGLLARTRNGKVPAATNSHHGKLEAPSNSDFGMWPPLSQLHLHRLGPQRWGNVRRL